MVVGYCLLFELEIVCGERGEYLGSDVLIVGWDG